MHDDLDELRVLLSMKTSDLDWTFPPKSKSMAALRVLFENMAVVYVGDLVQISDRVFLTSVGGIGASSVMCRKLLNETREVLSKLGLRLGMDLTSDVWDRNLVSLY